MKGMELYPKARKDGDSCWKDILGHKQGLGLGKEHRSGSSAGLEGWQVCGKRCGAGVGVLGALGSSSACPIVPMR